MTRWREDNLLGDHTGGARRNVGWNSVFILFNARVSFFQRAGLKRRFANQQRIPAKCIVC